MRRLVASCDEAVIKMARVDGLNNREIAARRRAHGGARSADPQERRLAAAAILTSFRKRGALSLRAAYREGLRGSREGSIPRADGISLNTARRPPRKNVLLRFSERRSRRKMSPRAQGLCLGASKAARRARRALTVVVQTLEVEPIRGLEVALDHAASTAFQISGAVLYLTRSLSSLN